MNEIINIAGVECTYSAMSNINIQRVLNSSDKAKTEHKILKFNCGSYVKIAASIN